MSWGCYFICFYLPCQDGQLYVLLLLRKSCHWERWDPFTDRTVATEPKLVQCEGRHSQILENNSRTSERFLGPSTCSLSRLIHDQVAVHVNWLHGLLFHFVFVASPCTIPSFSPPCPHSVAIIILHTTSFLAFCFSSFCAPQLWCTAPDAINNSLSPEPTLHKNLCCQ